MAISFTLPPVLHDYSFVRMLGSGSTGDVFLALHTPTNLYCAIKIIKIEDGKLETKEYIMREIKMMSKFDHAFIVKLYNYFIEHKCGFTYVYIVMEYCERGSLFEIINQYGRLSERMVSTLFIETLFGLLEIHRNNIIHRDLKLENILIDSHGHFRISDFGFSRELPPDSNINILTYCGSPAYVAPEVIKKEKYSTSADIWSFGVILYTVLYGRFPFDSESITELMKDIVTCEPRFTNEVSEVANDLLRKMLEKDPSKRITINEILKHKFFVITKSDFDNGDVHTISNKCYLSDLSNWSFPSLEKKIIAISKVSMDEMKLMIKNHDINEKTAIFKIIRDKFLQDVIYSKFGGCNNDYKPGLPCAMLKFGDDYVEASPVILKTMTPINQNCKICNGYFPRKRIAKAEYSHLKLNKNNEIQANKPNIIYNNMILKNLRIPFRTNKIIVQ